MDPLKRPHSRWREDQTADGNTVFYTSQLWDHVWDPRAPANVTPGFSVFYKRPHSYTDQGSQFTSAAFTDRVQAAGARCSMDGRGRCLDNVFIERLWRSLKYEAVYLHELADGFVAEQVISEWMTFYSDVRPHSALGGRTPAEAYREERAA